MAKMTVEINVGFAPVADTSKKGNEYRGVLIQGYHKPAYLSLSQAKTLLTLVSDKAGVADLTKAIAAAETRGIDKPKA